MGQAVRRHTELAVYRRAFGAAMAIFEVTRDFPKEEQCALTEQIRRSSRSVCATIAEGWRRRRYAKSFVSKRSESESEAAETQVWLEFAVQRGYLDRSTASDLYRTYDTILHTLVGMIRHADKWILPSP